MSNIFINLSAISENTTVLKSLYYFKGNPSINFILSGIDESINAALTLDINWGDGTTTEFSQKDIVFNYKKESIFNEVLYGKVGGTILDNYKHTYVPSTSSFFTNLTAQFVIHYNNGFYANIKQPIKLIKESYYDNIQKLGITSTQMTGASGSNTVANLQSKFNDSTYITFLNN
jgi:hypothetical protein|tara:strand:- start:559 stop:1080 length:522 start_codon:yes stop_codon:yes gene_type:complete